MAKAVDFPGGFDKTIRLHFYPKLNKKIICLIITATTKALPCNPTEKNTHKISIILEGSPPLSILQMQSTNKSVPKIYGNSICCVAHDSSPYFIFFLSLRV